jgi:hypothetical protein
MKKGKSDDEDWAEETSHIFLQQCSIFAAQGTTAKRCLHV